MENATRYFIRTYKDTIEVDVFEYVRIRAILREIAESRQEERDDT